MASKQSSKAAKAGPAITSIAPVAAIAGGELHIRGTGFASQDGRPAVYVGSQRAHLTIAGENYIVAKVPEGASAGDVFVTAGEARSAPVKAAIGVQVAESLHPVANPAVDAEGNLYSTFSNARGQKSPVSIYKIDTNQNSKPFVTDLMNPTGLAFDRSGLLYVSSRYDGIVYQVTPAGNTSVFVEGMGVATGLAFDSDENLYVGDRSGTVFKISRSRQIFVFATLEPSIAAYHLAFGPEDDLFVAGPTTSSFDCVYRITRSGDVETWYRGIGRPQGLAFDAEGNLYVAGSIGGRRGVLRFSPDKQAEQFLSGPGIVGLAFAPDKAVIVATQNALYRVPARIAGRPMP
ncbi:MAG TPA: IPT/TIG domain-containing protein [Rhizomicrobium sp.]|nr:IPT/TIG domain-containing protein [Rhizomicrobium sp.]